MMAYKSVVFDLDGTLLDTVGDIADAVNLALEAYNLETQSLSRFRSLVGAGLDELLVDLLGNTVKDELFFRDLRAEVVAHYNKRLTYKTRPYPGIHQLLLKLHKKQIPKAVLSNKAHDKTCQIVQYFFGNEYLHPIIGAQDGIPLKPDPGSAQKIAEQLNLFPEDIIYVGDTPTDMKTAIRAGMLPLGVAWGFRPEKELIEGGAYDVLKHPDNLLAFLRNYDH